jgi:predicted ATPase
VGKVSVTLLGGFSATVDGRTVDAGAWRLKKARELIKLLALAPNHRLHREQVMDVLWRERDPAAAANNLHQAVYVARRALGPDVITVREEMLTLAAEVDVEQLEHAAAEARRLHTPAAYRAALAAYGGELLPENRYDDWVQERRDALAELAAELEDELSRLPDDDPWHAVLPSDTSSFIGRDRELADLSTLLRGTRLLTLAGAGGVGKTRLALALARAAEGSFADGAALVELGELDDAQIAPEAVAAALDVRPLSGQTPLDAIVAFLGHLHVLLVLDNCEHLLAASAEMATDLLRAAPQLAIVATSREPLAVPGEVVFRVPSLDIPDPRQRLTPGQLLDFEAVRLFVDRAQSAAPGFALDEHNATDIARICFRLDGLPLALELAAGRLGALGASAVAERLDDRFRLLRSTGHVSPTRQHTLAATLDWSHELLASPEQALFRRLAAFAGTFDLAAVEMVCAGGEVKEAEVADLLARLVEKSLVAIDEGTSREHRYRLLETVRPYARQRLTQADELQHLIRAQARWALARAEQERGSPQLDRDAANLRAAFDTLLSDSPTAALRLCVALMPFWMRRIDLEEARRRFDQALAAVPERTIARSRALIEAAAIDYRSGAVAHGLARAEESHAIATDNGDTHGQWRALQCLGEFGFAIDDAEVAIGWLERALKIARRESFGAEEAIGVYSVGVAHWMRGDLEAAEQFIGRSSELFIGLTASSDTIRSPVNFAETSHRDGRPGLRVVFEDTLLPFVEISPGAAVAHVIANQAGVVRARGDLPRARVLLDESAARFAESGDRHGEAAVLMRRAYLELASGSPTDARAALEQAHELRQRQQDRRGVGLVLTGLGLLDTIAADYDSAERHLAEARGIFRRAGDRWGLASALWRTSDLAVARGRIDDAESALLEARSVLGATQRERWIANTLAGLAEIALLRGDDQHARALLLDARGRYAERHDALGVADVDRRLSELANRVLSPFKEPARKTPLTS